MFNTIPIGYWAGAPTPAPVVGHQMLWDTASKTWLNNDTEPTWNDTDLSDGVNTSLTVFQFSTGATVFSVDHITGDWGDWRMATITPTHIVGFINGSNHSCRIRFSGTSAFDYSILLFTGIAGVYIRYYTATNQFRFAVNYYGTDLESTALTPGIIYNLGVRIESIISGTSTRLTLTINGVDNTTVDSTVDFPSPAEADIYAFGGNALTPPTGLTLDYYWMKFNS